jgi:VanZ family protein
MTLLTSTPKRTERLAGRLAGRLAALARADGLWRKLLPWLVATVAFMALTPVPPQQMSSGWDKADHVLAFAALALAGWLGHGATRRGGALVVVLLAGYGGFIELAQMLVPNRSAEWRDLLADLVGVACGTLLAAGARRAAR